MTDPVEKPVWWEAEFAADRARERTARLLFNAIVYVGDQLGRVVDLIEKMQNKKGQHG
jgi:arylsulfatase A-like enzyme